MLIIMPNLTIHEQTINALQVQWDAELASATAKANIRGWSHGTDPFLQHDLLEINEYFKNIFEAIQMCQDGINSSLKYDEFDINTINIKFNECFERFTPFRKKKLEALNNTLQDIKVRLKDESEETILIQAKKYQILYAIEQALKSQDYHNIKSVLAEGLTEFYTEDKKIKYISIMDLIKFLRKNTTHQSRIAISELQCKDIDLSCASIVIWGKIKYDSNVNSCFMDIEVYDNSHKSLDNLLIILNTSKDTLDNEIARCCIQDELLSKSKQPESWFEKLKVTIYKLCTSISNFFVTSITTLINIMHNIFKRNNHAPTTTTSDATKTTPSPVALDMQIAPESGSRLTWAWDRNGDPVATVTTGSSPLEVLQPELCRATKACKERKHLSVI